MQGEGGRKNVAIICWHDSTALIPTLKGFFLCRVVPQMSVKEISRIIRGGPDARSSYVITMSRLSHSPLPSFPMQIAAGRTPI